MNGVNWQPVAGPDVAAARARLLGHAREYFAAREVLEVDTPILSRFAVTDSNIESIAARTAVEPELYLQTSPEYKMKRLLAAGFGDIYQICKVFRDGELGRNHLPEFTMIEWYRLGFGLQDIMQETVDFIATLLGQPDLNANATFTSYKEAFETALGINPATASIDELRGMTGTDQALQKSLGNDRDAWLDLLFSEKVSANFADDRFSVIYHYPASQAALARLNPDDAAVADRFEVFLGKLELANGFVELCAANEQQQRFESDRKIRNEQGKPMHSFDPDLIAALHAGLPPCSGVAVGFDRVLMLQQNATDIAAVTHFVY